MAGKVKVPLRKPEVSKSEEIDTLLEVRGSKEPWAEYTLEDGTRIRRKDGSTVQVPQNIHEDFYFTAFRKQVVPVFNKALKNLLNIRNHLLLQLDLECGNITEEYFDKEEPKYLSDVETLPLETLKQQIRVLFGFTDLALDAGDISEILNCSVDDAEKALKYYISGE